MAGRDIDSGIEIDAGTFEKVKLRITRVVCPHCGRDHRFLLADGRRKVATDPFAESQISIVPDRA
jgi:hypothetical protein